MACGPTILTFAAKGYLPPGDMHTLPDDPESVLAGVGHLPTKTSGPVSVVGRMNKQLWLNRGDFTGGHRGNGIDRQLRSSNRSWILGDQTSGEFLGGFE